MQAEGRTLMKSRIRAIFLVVCGLVMAAGLVYADLKKGYYTPTELGSLRQPAPVELLPDSNYEASSYPVPALDLAPGDGLQEVQLYGNTCHTPRYISMHSPFHALSCTLDNNYMSNI